MKHWFKYFNELTVNELYNIYHLRCLVFVVEQNCPYQEVDEYDLTAIHLSIFQHNQQIGYARIIPPKNTHADVKIGRVVVHPDFRGKELGKLLMKLAIEKCLADYPEKDIKISAQSHLKQFYQEFGFKTEGEEYLEDNIPHIAMKRSFSLHQTI
ncbi:MAG: GNAT family N-acetyltransferase [Bacteroidia bacterium]|jgi:ElaA protein|nr:GNAT family N-acetyltransferase [Bacteroidia bacterium]